MMRAGGFFFFFFVGVAGCTAHYLYYKELDVQTEIRHPTPMEHLESLLRSGSSQS